MIWAHSRRDEAQRSTTPKLNNTTSLDSLSQRVDLSAHQIQILKEKLATKKPSLEAFLRFG